MTSLPLLTLVVCNFVTIGLLPILFFRRDGDYNLRWFATAAPFFVVPAVLLPGAFGVVEPVAFAGLPLYEAARLAAVVLSSASIALIAMTVGVHRVRLALWHQDDDAPVELVTRGPYARVRHPFYSAFLLAFFAAAIAFPHPVTAACLVYGGIALSATARSEERRLAESTFGPAYRDYMANTGRFFPGIGR